MVDRYGMYLFQQFNMIRRDSANRIMKKLPLFSWADRLYFTYGNPVKAKWNGLRPGLDGIPDVKFGAVKPNKKGV